MKGCTDYTKEATGWVRSQEKKSRFPRVLLLVIILVIVVIALLILLPDAPKESFSVDTTPDLQASQVQTALAQEPEPTAPPVASVPEPTTKLVIYLTGAVSSPGVYELEAGARLNDVIKDAGGLSEDAARSYLNLAAQLEDGVHVHIPTLTEIESGEAARIESSGATALTGMSGESGGSAQAKSVLVNINTADRAELETLPGVGTAIAQRIIDFREKNGAFLSIDQLKEVSGIGDKKFEELADKVCI
jgi:competence protein ComEA